MKDLISDSIKLSESMNRTTVKEIKLISLSSTFFSQPSVTFLLITLLILWFLSNATYPWTKAELKNQNFPDKRNFQHFLVLSKPLTCQRINIWLFYSLILLYKINALYPIYPILLYLIILHILINFSLFDCTPVFNCF